MAAATNDIPPWVIGVAGSTGAVLANAIVYPVDIVKTRLQVQLKKSSTTGWGITERNYTSTWDGIQSILRLEGYPGLYRGLLTSSIGTASTNYAYFHWYTVLRTLSMRRIQASSAMAADLGIGTAAGALAQLCTTPIAVIATRQQIRPDGERGSMIQVARDIINGPDGYAGLWKGMKASLLLSINPAITYGAYQRLRESFILNGRVPSPHEAFILGAASKGIATIITHPLIVARATLQSHGSPNSDQESFNSVEELMKYIIAQEGILGLYKGIVPQILKGLLVQGILMMIKERVEFIFIILFRYFRGNSIKVIMQRTRKVARYSHI